MKSRLKWYLPAFQVCLTVLLALLGNMQTQRLWRGLGTSTVWDYVAPGEMAMHLINLPAALLCTFVLNRSFQIGIEYSIAVFAGYVVLVALLWFSVGWCIYDYRRLFQSNPSLARKVRVLGIGIGALLLLLGLLLLKGVWPWSILFPLGMVVWGVTIIALFSRKHVPAPSQSTP